MTQEVLALLKSNVVAALGVADRTETRTALIIFAVFCLKLVEVEHLVDQVLVVHEVLNQLLFVPQELQQQRPGHCFVKTQSILNFVYSFLLL